MIPNIVSQVLTKCVLTALFLLMAVPAHEMQSPSINIDQKYSLISGISLFHEKLGEAVSNAPHLGLMS